RFRFYDTTNDAIRGYSPCWRMRRWRWWRRRDHNFLGWRSRRRWRSWRNELCMGGLRLGKCHIYYCGRSRWYRRFWGSLRRVWLWQRGRWRLRWIWRQYLNHRRWHDIYRVRWQWWKWG